MSCPTHSCNCCKGACCCGRHTCTQLKCDECESTTSVTSTKGYGLFMGYGQICADHDSGSPPSYYPYCDRPVGWCCNKATGSCARDSVNGPTISQCECYREKGLPPTIEWQANPFCEDPTQPCCPYGVCCYTNGTCGNETKCMCEYLGGNFLEAGEENVCDTGACCSGTTCTVRTKCACSVIGGATFKGYGTTCSPNPCTTCSLDSDCPEGAAKCCNGTCIPSECCVIAISTTCQATCNLGCTLITSGPNAGKFNCFRNDCNPLP
jgi:hypothetical protein